jgi:sarcosine oxidase / L-pipecolate oxidase
LYDKLNVIPSGSRHTFKNLPNVGKYVADLIEGKLSEELREAWRWRPEKVKGGEWAERDPWKNEQVREEVRRWCVIQ